MNYLIERVLSLSKQDLNIFFSIAYDDSDGLFFYRVLQGLDPYNRESFLKYIPEDWAAFFRETLVTMGIPSSEQLAEAATRVTSTLDNLSLKVLELEEINQKNRKVIEVQRNFMKECFSGEVGLTDQTKGVPIPPPQKEVEPESELIDLPDPGEVELLKSDVFLCINERESRRKYTEEPLSLNELSYLLWTSQGVKKVFRQGKMTLRTVPSGGARHPFETYLAINRVTSLKAGVYRYLPIDHTLVFLFSDENMVEKLSEGALDQKFVGNSAVVFIWSVIPYRGEWRYSIRAHKTMLLDAGHVCQNLYLACESLGLGTCAIAAYSQKLMDGLLGLDGNEEFVIYLSPVGKLK